MRWWRRLDATQVTGGFIAEVGGASALTLAVQPPNVDNVKYITGRNLRDAGNFSRFKSVSGGDLGGMNKESKETILGDHHRDAACATRLSAPDTAIHCVCNSRSALRRRRWILFFIINLRRIFPPHLKLIRAAIVGVAYMVLTVADHAAGIKIPRSSLPSPSDRPSRY